MPDFCSNSDPAHFSSIIQELTKEHADSHQHRFFGNPLLTSHITLRLPCLNSPRQKTGRACIPTGIQKRYACPSRVPEPRPWLPPGFLNGFSRSVSCEFSPHF